MQAIPAAWRGDIAAANPPTATPTTSDQSNARLAAVAQQPLTAALLDRLLHHAQIVPIAGQSYRLKHQRQTGMLQVRKGDAGG